MKDVEVTQYLRPDGRTSKSLVAVPNDVAKLKDQLDLIISAEVLPAGQVAIYSRLSLQPEEQEKIFLATNGPGQSSPANTVVKAILSYKEDRP